MGLRDDIEALTARDTQETPHHRGPGRVDPHDLHPSLEGHERASKVRAAYGARAVVEAFHAALEDRAMRPLDEEPADLALGSRFIFGPPLHEAQGVRIHKCAYDTRGIVEVMCDADDFTFDLPVYLVNPPMLVADPNGDIELVVGEYDSGEPITETYREDPTQAMLDILADLKNEGDA